MSKQDNVSLFRALGIYDDVLRDINRHIECSNLGWRVDTYLSYCCHQDPNIIYFFARYSQLGKKRNDMYKKAIEQIKYLKDEH